MSPARLVSLAGVRWFAPHVAGKGWPIFADPKPPHERRCVAAYTTFEACQAGLALFPISGIEIREVDALEFNDGRAEVGLTVIVDLAIGGEQSSYHSFTAAVLSPGGLA